MNILVTGHRGFIGQNITKFLTNKGHDVYGFEYYDTKDNMPDLKNIHQVIHLGAETSTTETDIDLIMEKNYDFSVRLFEECEKRHIAFQYASSASVYGLSTSFSESDPCRPLNYYAYSKYMFDRYVESKLKTTPIRVQGFRYFNVYGPHEEHKRDQASPLTKFNFYAKKGKPIQIFEYSEQYHRDFVFVGDICELHLRMLDVNESGIWNAGTGVTTSFEEVALMIAEKHGGEVVTIPMPENLRGSYQAFTRANLDKLNRTIKMNWMPVEDYINYEL